MFGIKPEIQVKFTCPACAADLFPRNYFFQGMHTLAEVQCPDCGTEWYHTYPSGHGLYFPVAFRKDGSEAFYPKRSEDWFARPLIDSMVHNRKVPAKIEKRTRREYRHAVILNCLDNCYGHVFLKLINAQRHIDQEKTAALVIIIPKSFLWLVPEGVAEVWAVDIPLHQLNKQITTLNAFVQKELERFEAVYLSKAYTHSACNSFDVGMFTRQEKFVLSAYASSPPQITFILREDRLWLHNRVLSFICLASRKLRVYHLCKRFFVYFQNRSYKKLAGLIQKEFPDAAVASVGLGRQGRLGAFIDDQRVSGRMSEDNERKWCRIYAKSHIVVGIHGSHMLIPTSLAAGFIEILPRHKIDHVGEDIMLHHNSRYMYFLGRHLDESAGVHLVFSHIRNMLRDFSVIRNNVKRKY